MFPKLSTTKTLFQLFLFFATLQIYVGCSSVVAPEAGSEEPSSKDSLLTPGGVPAFIRLETVLIPQLSVRGVSGMERTTLKFRVTDKEGLPAAEGSVIVFYSSALDSVATLQNGSDSVTGGQVLCTVVSGLRSGTVSLTASYSERVGEVKAISEGVPLLVVGGPPCQERFALVIPSRNIPRVEGESFPFTVWLGDRFGNAAAKRMVHLRSSLGVVSSGGESDSNGMLSGEAVLFSPWPDSVTGFLEGSTFDGNGATLTVRSSFVLSGTAQLTVTEPLAPDTFNVQQGGETLIRFKVSDERGTPLCSGTRITAALSGGGVVMGDVDNTMIDCTSGHTDYTVVITDDQSGPRKICLTLSVTGRNGSVQKLLWGRVR